MPVLALPGWLLAAGVVIALLVVTSLSGRILRPWIMACAHGVRLTLADVAGMYLRRSDPERILRILIRAHRAGLEASARNVEGHALAGGDIERTMNAMIAAHARGVSITWETLAAVDLRKEDVVQFIDNVAPDVDTADEPPAEDEPDPVGAVGTAEGYVPLPGRVVIDGRTGVAFAEETPIERGATVEVVDTMICLVVRPKGL